MTGHEEIRRMLALAAAGALGEVEQRLVERHVAGCAACARELHAFSELAGALGRLPTPPAPALMVERTRRLVEREAAAAQESRAQAGVLVFVTVVAWAFIGSMWVACEALGYRLGPERLVVWSLVWVALSTLPAGFAAAVIASRRRAWRSL